MIAWFPAILGSSWKPAAEPLKWSVIGPALRECAGLEGSIVSASLAQSAPALSAIASATLINEAGEIIGNPC